MIVIAVLLALLGPCRATGPPQQAVTQEQIHVLNRMLDALHEEVTAAGTPSTWPFVLFLLTLVLPLVLAVWLLRGAEQSAIGHDETIRTLVRHGLSEHVVRHYLEEQARPQLPGAQVTAQQPPSRPCQRQRPRQRHRRHRPTRRPNRPDAHLHHA